MKLNWMLVVLIAVSAGPLGVRCRHVRSVEPTGEDVEGQQSLEHLIVPTDRQGVPAEQETDEFVSLSSDPKEPLEFEKRGDFEFLLSQLGSFIYRKSVKPFFTRPVKERTIPDELTDRAVNFFETAMANRHVRRALRLVSPIRPALSSYAVKKFEEGVAWTFKRGANYLLTNFIEFPVAARK